jgi:hypothetical protein
VHACKKIESFHPGNFSGLRIAFYSFNNLPKYPEAELISWSHKFSATL